MTTRKSMRRTAISALLATMILVGCGGGTPESTLASARDYMAKSDNKAAVIQLKNVLQNNPNLPEARFLLGKALLDGGDVVAAEVELRKANELKHPADQVIPLLARAQLIQGQSKKIIDDLAKIQLTSAESKADLLTTTALAYLVAGKPNDAKAAFEGALAAFPDYGPALIGQARMQAGNRDFPGALALLASVLEKSPKLYEAWQLKGDILYATGDSAGASDAYRKALEIKPDYVPAHYSLISRLIEAGNFDEAGKQLEAMKKVASRHPQTSYLQAEIFYRQKNFKPARDAIQQYLKVLPDSQMGLQLAGAIEYELKSYSLAESYLLRGMPKTQELGLARQILIASYLRSGQPAKALSTLQPVLGTFENNSNMLALAGDVFMQNGDADKAEAYFKKAAALDPANTTKRTSLALSHLLKGETETAYRELEQIASVDAGTTVDTGLIASQLKKRQFDKALKSIDGLEKKQPDKPLAHNLRGIALLGKGEVAAARKSFEQALVKNPTYYPAAASLANLDMAEKKPDDGKKRFEEIVAKDPKNVQALLALAELRARTGGKAEDVAPLVDKAIAANPADVAPRLALINLYLSAKDTKKAASAAQDALGLFPEHIEILDAAGRAQQAAADFNQALVTYGKLATLLPNSPLPYLRMADIQVLAKNKEAAMQSLRKALSVKANSIEAQRGIMMLDLDAGRFAEALVIARQVQNQRPKEAVGYVLEGDVHALNKSWAEATSAYRNGIRQTGATDLAIKLHAALLAGANSGEADKFADSWVKEHAKDLPFRLYLAEAASVRKDYASASKHYRVLVDAQPNNPGVLNNLAWTAAQNKDPKAIEYAEKAYKLAPDQAAVIDTLGGLLVEKGDTARGLALLQKAASLAPQSALIRFNLAKALIAAGKKDEAKKQLDELVKLGEKFPAQAEVGKMLQSL